MNDYSAGRTTIRRKAPNADEKVRPSKALPLQTMNQQDAEPSGLDTAISLVSSFSTAIFGEPQQQPPLDESFETTLTGTGGSPSSPATDDDGSEDTQEDESAIMVSTLNKASRRARKSSTGQQQQDQPLPGAVTAVVVNPFDTHITKNQTMVAKLKKSSVAKEVQKTKEAEDVDTTPVITLIDCMNPCPARDHEEQPAEVDYNYYEEPDVAAGPVVVYSELPLGGSSSRSFEAGGVAPPPAAAAAAAAIEPSPSFSLLSYMNPMLASSTASTTTANQNLVTSSSWFSGARSVDETEHASTTNNGAAAASWFSGARSFDAAEQERKTSTTNEAAAASWLSGAKSFDEAEHERKASTTDRAAAAASWFSGAKSFDEGERKASTTNGAAAAAVIEPSPSFSLLSYMNPLASTTASTKANQNLVTSTSWFSGARSFDEAEHERSVYSKQVESSEPIQRADGTSSFSQQASSVPNIKSSTSRFSGVDSSDVSKPNSASTANTQKIKSWFLRVGSFDEAHPKAAMTSNAAKEPSKEQQRKLNSSPDQTEELSSLALLSYINPLEAAAMPKLDKTRLMDEEDEEIATVFSKEYHKMADSFSAALPAQSGRDITIPMMMPVPLDDDALKIVGIDTTPKKKTRGFEASNAEQDLEWTEHGPVDPALLTTPVKKIVEQEEQEEQQHQLHQPESKFTEKNRCSRRWLVVLMLAGIVVAAALLAAGFSVAHKSSTAYTASSINAAPEDQGTPNSPSMPDGQAQDKPNEENPPTNGVSVLPTSPATSATITTGPTSAPTTRGPTFGPTAARAPTFGPTAAPTAFQSKSVVFAAIGDVPYNSKQKVTLTQQMEDVDPNVVEFVIHLGDIRDAKDKPECLLSDYESTAEILKLSAVPVFIILGDNDWDDCPNQEEGLEYWQQTFRNFESNWEHDFNITRQPNRVDNFSFERNGILFIGLKIPGGTPQTVDETTEWEDRLQDQYAWTAALIKDYDLRMNQYTGRVVVFGHANPNKHHATFFDQLSDFIGVQFQNRMPVLYLNGDEHKWMHDTDFYGQEAFLRITVAGEAKEPATIIEVVADGDTMVVEDAFLYDRSGGDNDDDGEYIATVVPADRMLDGILP